MSFKILHLTDSHLFADAQQTLMGIATQNSFASVIAHIRASKIKPDLILLTGDISQDNTRASYRYCLEQLDVLKAPAVLWVPGNHDTVEHMQALMPSFSAEKPALYTQGVWKIMALSTHASGCIEGYLTQEQLNFVAQTLSNDAERYFLLAMHHHPGSVNCAWLDKHNLKNDQALLSILKQAKHKPTLICGHVHQDYRQHLDSVTVLSTPSTCFQFKPNTPKFTLDKEMPGYRWLHLEEDGTLTTEVIRVAQTGFNIDVASQGY